MKLQRRDASHRTKAAPKQQQSTRQPTSASRSVWGEEGRGPPKMDPLPQAALGWEKWEEWIRTLKC